MKWAVGILAIALAGVITWAMVSQSRWEDRCHRAGGRIEHRRDGMTVVVIGKVPVPQPRYTDHCWIEGREVHV